MPPERHRNTWVAALEQERSTCKLQAFGVLAVVDLADDLVVAASSARHPIATLYPGQKVQDVFGRSAEQMIAGIGLPLGPSPACIGRFTSNDGVDLLLLAQPVREGSQVILEALPVGTMETPETALSDLRWVDEQLGAATDERALLQAVVTETRRLTSFDRVVVHRLLPDGSDVVLAEASNGALPSLQGHQRPAGSLSSALRAELQQCESRFVPDVEYEPQRLITLPNRPDSPPDLSRCLLHAVPQACLDFLHQAGVRGSLSLPILVGGKLWGLINCHHARPLGASYALVEKSRHLASMLGKELGARLEQQVEATKHRVEAARDALLEKIARPDFTERELLLSGSELLEFVPADGIAIICEHKIACLGLTPERADVRRLAHCLGPLLTPRNGLFVTDELATYFPRAASFSEKARGLLAIRVSPAPATTILWFRRSTSSIPQLNGLDPRACYLTDLAISPTSDLDGLSESAPPAGSQAWDPYLVQQANLFQERASFVFQQRHIQALNRQLREANRQLAELAETDPLTGLANRRIFDARLAEEWNRAQRDCRPLSLILIDVDFFKRYNDHYGHPAGDSCLMEVAGAVKASARRAGDLAARIGGEEFALLLPRTTVKSAEMIAERLRRSVLELGIEHADTPGGRVSISLGVASTSPHCSTVVTRGHLVKTADVALYAAKSQGRNQVHVHAL